MRMTLLMICKKVGEFDIFECNLNEMIDNIEIKDEADE